MRHIFIAHEGHLLQEYPVAQVLWTKKQETRRRTQIVEGALKTLGRVQRLNLTLWLLATERTPTEVSDQNEIVQAWGDVT